MNQYVRYLQENSHEIDLLFKELLIGVTNFFREQDAFAVLKENVIPQMLKTKRVGDPIRIWVVGCSTGEEAYSIAIVLRECLDDLKPKGNFKIQIYATDIDKEAIDLARQGTYPANITADVSAERLERFFTKEDENYRIRKEIRDLIIFAPQNILTDPPFTKLDMLSCRNLLIYLNAETQKKLLPLFHYSLGPGGFLFRVHRRLH
jgi:two-component system CheB/CheR fusion protein